MEILCPKCRKKYQISDSMAGKQARCKNQSCGQVFTLPAPAAIIAPVAVAAAPPAKPAPAAGASPATSSLLDELPPMPMDDLPEAGMPSVVVPSYRPSRSKGSHKNALMLGGVIAAVLIVGLLLVMVVSRLFVGGGASGWSPYDYIPDNAQFVAYVNVDDLRNCDLYTDAEFRKLIDEKSPQVQRDLVDNVSEVFRAGRDFGSNDESLAVLRLKEDRALKDILPTDRRQQQTENFQNVEYAFGARVFGGTEWVVAKTGDRTFCFASTEDMLKKTLERLGRKQRAQLAAGLQSALDAVAGHPLYFAGITPTVPGMPFKVDRFYCLASVTSSVRIKATVIFADANQATSCKQMIDGGIGMIKAKIPPDKKNLLDPIVSVVNIRQNGTELCCEATWQCSDILALMKAANEARGAFPGRPPGIPPGLPGGPARFPGMPGQ